MVIRCFEISLNVWNGYVLEGMLVMAHEREIVLYMSDWKREVNVQVHLLTQALTLLRMMQRKKTPHPVLGLKESIARYSTLRT